MLNLNKYFGKNLKIKNRATPEEIPTEEELFIESINLLEVCWERSNHLFENFGINLIDFEADYHQIAENLFLVKYGLVKTEIILWYIFGRLDENMEVTPLILQTKGKEDEKIYLVTAKDLWDLINKIEEYKKEDDNNE
jgi:hypothetical protein